MVGWVGWGREGGAEQRATGQCGVGEVGWNRVRWGRMGQGGCERAERAGRAGWSRVGLGGAGWGRVGSDPLWNNSRFYLGVRAVEEIRM